MIVLHAFAARVARYFIENVLGLIGRRLRCRVGTAAVGYLIGILVPLDPAGDDLVVPALGFTLLHRRFHVFVVSVGVAEHRQGAIRNFPPRNLHENILEKLHEALFLLVVPVRPRIDEIGKTFLRYRKIRISGIDLFVGLALVLQILVAGSFPVVVILILLLGCLVRQINVATKGHAEGNTLRQVLQHQGKIGMPLDDVCDPLIVELILG